jgi:hypothetical protein
MAETSHGRLPPDVVELRAAVEAERHQQILGSLTARTTVAAIEGAHQYLSDPDSAPGHPAEREAQAAEWRAFRAAAAEGGEVWAFCSVGSCSSFEGFAVICGGRVVAECITSGSTWI